MAPDCWRLERPKYPTRNETPHSWTAPTTALDSRITRLLGPESRHPQPARASSLHEHLHEHEARDALLPYIKIARRTLELLFHKIQEKISQFAV